MQISKRHSAGIALIMTLLLLVILVVLVGQISYATKIDLYIAENSKDDLQVRYALISALNIAIAYLQLDAMQEANSKARYDSLKDEWARKIWSADKPQQLGNTRVYYTICDESAKFNLLDLLATPKKSTSSNNSSEKPSESPSTNDGKKKTGQAAPAQEDSAQDRFDRLLKSILGKNSPIDAKKVRKNIVDWMKKKKGKPGSAAGPFPTEVPLFSVKELLLVKGIEPPLLFGETISKKKIKGLDEYVTIWSNSKINVNTADKKVLQSLNSEIDENLADAIISYRQEKSGEQELQVFQKKTDFEAFLKKQEKQKLYPKVESLISVKSSFFGITATAQCGRIIKKLQAIVYRKGKNVYKLYCDFVE